MKRICICGEKYEYNIGQGITEYVSDEVDFSLPVNFCHNCGTSLKEIDINVLLKEYFEPKEFMYVINAWNDFGGYAICKYNDDIHIYSADMTSLSEFKLDLGMILYGDWYIAKDDIETEILESRLRKLKCRGKRIKKLNQAQFKTFSHTRNF